MSVRARDSPVAAFGSVWTGCDAAAGRRSTIASVADPVAIASLIATPTIVAAYSYFQKRYEMQRSERAELRTTLDSAASELATAQRIGERYDNIWLVGAAARAEFERVEHDHELLLPLVRAAGDRIAIRAGRSSDVFSMFECAGNRVNAYWDRGRQGCENEESYDADEAERLRQAVVDGRQRFLDAAVVAAGFGERGAPSPLYPSLALPPGRDS